MFSSSYKNRGSKFHKKLQSRTGLMHILIHAHTNTNALYCLLFSDKFIYICQIHYLKLITMGTENMTVLIITTQVNGKKDDK